MRDPRGELFHIASEAVRLVAMPNMEDIEKMLPKSASQKLRRELRAITVLAERQSRSYGVRIRSALDAMRKDGDK